MKKVFWALSVVGTMAMFNSCDEGVYCNGKITITNNKSNDYWITISGDDNSFVQEFELKEGYYREIKNLDAGTYSIIAEKEGAIFEGLTTKTTTITLGCDDSKMWIID